MGKAKPGLLAQLEQVGSFLKSQEPGGNEGNGMGKIEQMSKRKRISLVNPSIKRTEHLLCARYWEFSAEQNDEGSGPELTPSLFSRA